VVLLVVRRSVQADLGHNRIAAAKSSRRSLGSESVETRRTEAARVVNPAPGLLPLAIVRPCLTAKLDALIVLQMFCPASQSIAKCGERVGSQATAAPFPRQL
jgi:hypothetical protein